jgi:endonuclease YncB( thermonuclease family)
METASRIFSILLGAAVMVFVLWPITIPLGFGEVWWASRQAQTRVETDPPPAPAPPPKPAESTEPPAASSAPVPTELEPLPPAKQAADPQQTATVETQAAAPQAATKLYRRVTVRDGGSLQADGVVISLAGIAAREADATCKGAGGKTWRCGAAAKAALAKLIRARAVTCTRSKSGEHKIVIARCSVAGTDLSTWMVRQGWAEPKDTNEAPLAEAAAAAKQERLGLWRDGD